MRHRWIVALTAFTALCVAAPGASAQPNASCTLEPTGGVKTRVVNGRSYELHVPAGLSGPSVPLLVTMHGFSSWGSAHEFNSGWSEFANRHGFAVAYPTGLGNAWHFGEDSYEVTFLKDLVADVSARWCIDPARVYASGHSNGGFMAQRLACDAHDVFAAVTEYAGGDPEELGPCRPERGVSVGLFHGEADTVVSIRRGEGARDAWIRRNGCSETPATVPVPEGTLLSYRGCRDGAEVAWRTYPGQSHFWPEGPRAEDLRARMWAFMTEGSPEHPALVLSDAGVTNRAFRVGRPARLRTARRRAPRGTHFLYTLSRPATVTIRVQRQARRRRAGRRWRRAGTLTVAGGGGRNATPFSGRIAGRRLRPGRHRALLVASDGQGARSGRVRVRFRVVR